MKKCKSCKRELVEGRNIHRCYTYPMCRKCRLKNHDKLRANVLKDLRGKK